MSGRCPEPHLRNFFEKKFLKDLQKALIDSVLGAFRSVLKINYLTVGYEIADAAPHRHNDSHANGDI